MKLSKDKYSSYTVRGLNNQKFLTYDDALYAAGYDDSRVKPQPTDEQRLLNNEIAKKSMAKKKNNEIKNDMGIDTDSIDTDFTKDNQLIQSN